MITPSDERDLVLIGGGHTHSLLLSMLAMRPLPNVRITLISDTVETPYSGMLPGYLAGHYTQSQTHVDLHALCQRANVRFIHDRVVGLDLAQKQIKLREQASVAYDKVSINTGSTPNLSVLGAAEFAVGVKPVSKMTEVWQELLSQPASGHWAVVGGGAAGVEVVLAIAHRFAAASKKLRLSLVHSGETILTGYEAKTRAKAYEALHKFNVAVVPNFDVAEVKRDSLVALDGKKLAVDQSIWCTPASAPKWPASAGLATDDQGFIAINHFLQSTSHPDVFACGDVATFIDNPKPKAGVYAVRSAPYLMNNLNAAFQQKNMKAANLQSDFLSLLSLGDKTAVGQRNGFCFSGHWVWRWKDAIDRKFMAQFKVAPNNMSTPSEVPMHCAGCGSKLGPQLLEETLAELFNGQGDDLHSQHDHPEDAAVVFQNADTKVWQSIDGFRAFTDNLYLFGKVSVYHALNDSYAMGLDPESAQVWPNLVYNHPRLTRRDFKRFMQGISDALQEHNTSLTGGHSTEGLETHLGVVVTTEGHHVWSKTTAQLGDWVLINKPLGTGILLAAQMQQKLSAHAYQALWQNLKSDNREFYLELRKRTVHAATDVTGFGLVGHALEMMNSSPYSMSINVDDVPCLPDALELASQGIASSLAPALEPLLVQCQLPHADFIKRPLFIDPQTNGGLMVCVSPQVGLELVEQGFGVKIGDIVRRQEKAIILQ